MMGLGGGGRGVKMGEKKMGERGEGKVVSDRRETIGVGWGGGGDSEGGVRLFLPLDSRGTKEDHYDDLFST